MAILHRYGNADQFDPYKMRPSEFAHVRVGNATYKAGFYACYAAGDTRYLITNQDMAELLNASADSYTALQQLISDLNTNPSEITNILSNISVLQSGKLDKTGDSQNNTVTFTEAITLANVATGETHTTLWGKVKKLFSFIGTTTLTTTAQTITEAINELVSGRIKTADIVQTDTTNSSTKVPSSAVTYALGAEIDTHTGQITTINNNLANYVPKNAVTTTNWNTITVSGFYKSVTTGTNSPNNSTYAIGTAVIFDGNWGYNVAFDLNGTTPKLYKNIKCGGTWTGWTELL